MSASNPHSNSNSNSNATSSYPTPARTPSPSIENEDDRPAPTSPAAADQGSSGGGAELGQGQGQGSDNGELEAFRRQWQAEVRRRRAEPASQSRSSTHAEEGAPADAGHDAPLDVGDAPAPAPAPASEQHEEAQPHSPSRTRHLLQLAEEQHRATLEARTAAASPGAPQQSARQRFNAEAPALASAGTRSQMRSAVKAYATAVENERRGNLDEALLYYRKAFRLDSSADRLYERASSFLRQREDGSQAQSSAQIAATEKQGDALLASAEVADMVRRATDFDDFRVVAMERQQAGRGDVKAGGEERSHRSREVVDSEATVRQGAETERDQLQEIIENAAQADVEGRDFNHITFRSPPSTVRSSPSGQQGDRAAGESIDDLTNGLERADLAAEDGPPPALPPPPPIAKLPDELLSHICRMVVEPRGRRGARLRPPRIDHPAHASHTKQAVSAGAAAGEAKAGKGSTGTATSQETNAHSDAATPRTRGTTGVGVVLAGPDWQSLEMLGRTCWKWRLVSRGRGTWKTVLDETYHSPQLALPCPSSALPNPRQTFIQHPRLRLTGCYIAACHYSRPGLSVDNAWVRVIHLVEFYRSVRFLPDGRALTLLTTEQPRDTVGKMHAGNTDKGFAVGRWRVEWPAAAAAASQSQSHSQAQSPANRAPASALVVIDDLRDASLAKYSFRMVLSLRCTQRGKWNKMEMQSYCSVNLETGEVLAVPQKHDRPFHFSAVKSFGV